MKSTLSEIIYLLKANLVSCSVTLMYFSITGNKADI